MNKKAYITPACTMVLVESAGALLSLSIKTGTGTGEGLSSGFDGSQNMSDPDSFSWRDEE